MRVRMRREEMIGDGDECRRYGHFSTTECFGISLFHLRCGERSLYVTLST